MDVGGKIDDENTEKTKQERCKQRVTHDRICGLKNPHSTGSIKFWIIVNDLDIREGHPSSFNTDSPSVVLSGLWIIAEATVCITESLGSTKAIRELNNSPMA